MTCGTPASSGPKISQTESTNEIAVFWHITSPGWNGKSRHIQAKRFTVARCVPITPLGRPVDPEV